MGGGTYSISSRDARISATYGVTNAASMDSYTLTNTVFSQRSINNAMDPHGLVVRESRDSAEHPNSLAIIIALDLTGSMGSIPHFLVKEGLPSIVSGIIERGEKDPQVLFMGVGDHQYDTSPLQVGQFESSDELLDKWLTSVYLEGGGGGNDGESYLLAWYTAAQHTSIDCYEKRKRKGYLFTIGDEPTLTHVPANNLKNLIGEGQFANYSASQLLEKAREKYNVYHIHVKETRSGSRQSVIDSWKQLMKDDLIVVERHEDIAQAIINKVKAKTTQVVDNVTIEEML